jgi:putative ABC transport system substrate-binding protein
VKRRAFIAGALAVVTAPLAAQEKPAARVYRIGVLETVPMTMNLVNMKEFRKGMRELGYVEGPNLVIAYRSAEGRSERYAELAAELMRFKADAILTRGTPATLAAKNVAGAIPIVTAAVADPVESGLAETLEQPGGNVTGLTSVTRELTPKRIELIKALVPNLTRIAAYTNLSNIAAVSSWKDIELTARSMGLEPQLLDVRRPEQIASAFEEAVRQRADALIVGIETLTQSNRRAIVELAAQHRLPAMYSVKDFVEGGGLISYGVSYPHLYYRAAAYVDKILKGAKPGELAMERPAKFELVINRKTARALGLVIPPDLFLRADRVID